MTCELPAQVDEEALVLGKGGYRRHYRVKHQMGIQAIDEYKVGERRSAIRAAQRSGAYAAVVNPLEVVRTTGQSTTQMVHLTDGRMLSVANMKRSDRLRLFVRKEGSLEPAWFWLTESGTPINPTSWEKPFAEANRRVTAARASLGISSPGVRVTPHSLRFTFALLLLLAGVRAIDSELGIGKAGAFNARNYTQAFDDVQDLLGHASQDTTRRIYLEPLKGLRRSSILSSGSLDEMWDQLAKLGSLVGFGS
ncbi:hypothetical protein ASF62_10885 [Leifsonia sp. Leaf325]|nr:hypothetical protein ASF62_10885 [Leifsonia sp. Leaf325]